jgi:hypothetical protein
MNGGLAIVRRSVFAATVCGCTATAAYVTVPMSQVGAGADASADDATLAAPLGVTFRPLPPEPAPASSRARCRREVSCRAEEDAAPAPSFPPPFERCAPDNGDGAKFSARETRETRRGDGHACCYVAFADCRT